MISDHIIGALLLKYTRNVPIYHFWGPKIFGSSSCIFWYRCKGEILRPDLKSSWWDLFDSALKKCFVSLAWEIQVPKEQISIKNIEKSQILVSKAKTKQQNMLQFFLYHSYLGCNFPTIGNDFPWYNKQNFSKAINSLWNILKINVADRELGT